VGLATEINKLSKLSPNREKRRLHRFEHNTNCLKPVLCSKEIVVLSVNYFSLFQVTQELEADSEKETHSFSAAFSTLHRPLHGGAIVLFKPPIESFSNGCFWKLEQISLPRKVFLPDDGLVAVGRIAKVLVTENGYTKVAAPWRDARLTVDDIYKRLYMNHTPDRVIQRAHDCRFPMEATEELVAIAFVLRYSEDELKGAPLQLNINIRGNELPGASRAGIVINLRTGRKVVTEASNEKVEKSLGGLAVLMNNPAEIQIREIDEEFTKYLLRRFGNGSLQMVIYCDEGRACVFCNEYNIKKPFGSSCCMLT